MKKVAKLAQKERRESDLRGKLELSDRIRTDTVNDIESLTSDFQHMIVVVESIQRNYQAILAQNRQLKDTLLSLVEECYCWQGNRCDRCQRMLHALGVETPKQELQNPTVIPTKLPKLGVNSAKEKLDPVQEYKAILKQLRKRKLG